MKKLITLVIAAVMILSMIPVMTFTSSAAPLNADFPEPSDDFWSVWRTGGYYDIEEGDPYQPAAGYEYTDEGFRVISPEFGEYGVRVHAQSSQSVNLKEGFYMEVRVDDFSYKGEKGNADEWISFSIADNREVNQGGTAWANSWFCLIRGSGNGAADTNIMECYTVRDTDEADGKFNPGYGGFGAFSPIVRDGKEYYTFEISWDGSAYVLKVNGAAATGITNLTSFIDGLENTYVGVTFHSTQKGGKADFTITKQGTSEADADVPEGDDSREPEENILIYGDPVDPSTVPENQPALIFDANKTSHKKDPTGSNLTLTPTGSGAYHAHATADVPYFVWSIKSELTYMAQDFPVFVMMLKNFIGDDGGVYFSAGEVVGSTDTYMTGWSQWNDDARFYGGDEEYTYIVLDLSQMIESHEELQGRIHNIRPHFSVDPTDEDMCEWDIEFMAYFRSVDEALAYAEWYNETVIVPNIETEDPNETTADDDETTEGGDETTVGGDETTEGGDDETAVGEDETTVGDDETTVGGDETTVGGDETTADTKAEETKAEEEGGCGSVIAVGAVGIMVAAAAAVVLKKKD